ncbi:MAG: glycosyltransferase family 2 protein [Janthinobacterium lividum]
MTAFQHARRADPGRVGATIVFYLPDAGCVARANRLAAFGLTVVVVDNTPDDEMPIRLETALDPSITVVANRSNLGIGRALNQGIDALRAAGCDWALLFDQDSQPSETLLAELPQAAAALTAHDPTIALLGPAYQDPRLGAPAPFIRFRAFKAKRIPSTGSLPVDVDFLITSGSCLNLLCWPSVGPMDESLFIDSVDLEWCMRARAKGWRLLGIPWLTMQHSLGGEPINVLGLSYPSHSPLRHYYMCRNATALCLRRYVPWTWKSLELVKMPLRLALYGCFFRPRSAHLGMALKGILHGLTGQAGKLETEKR